MIRIRQDKLTEQLTGVLGNRDGFMLTDRFLRPFTLVGSAADTSVLASIRKNLFAGDLYLLSTDNLRSFPTALRITLLVTMIYLFMVSLWIFPLEARFVNTIFATLKNAFFVSVLAFPRTLGMAGMTLLPVIPYYFFDLRLLPILLMFGFSGPGYVCAYLYSKVFKRFEPEEDTTDTELKEILTDDVLPGEQKEGGNTDD